MEEFNEVEVFFRTSTRCTVKVPKKFKSRKKIENFILDKLIDENIDDWIAEWFEFEVEDFEVVEE